MRHISIISDFWQSNLTMIRSALLHQWSKQKKAIWLTWLTCIFYNPNQNSMLTLYSSIQLQGIILVKHLKLHSASKHIKVGSSHYWWGTQYHATSRWPSTDLRPMYDKSIRSYGSTMSNKSDNKSSWGVLSQREVF